MELSSFNKYHVGTSLVARWIRLCASNAGSVGLIRTQGQGIRVSKLGLHMPCSQKTETNKQKKQTADGPQYFKIFLPGPL